MTFCINRNWWMKVITLMPKQPQPVAIDPLKSLNVYNVCDN